MVERCIMIQQSVIFVNISLFLVLSRSLSFLESGFLFFLFYLLYQIQACLSRWFPLSFCLLALSKHVILSICIFLKSQNSSGIMHQLPRRFKFILQQVKYWLLSPMGFLPKLLKLQEGFLCCLSLNSYQEKKLQQRKKFKEV